MKQNHSIAILSAAMLALAGCGGGGSGTPPNLSEKINAIPGLMDNPKPVYAEDADDTVESLAGTEFGTLSSAISRTFGDEPGVSLPDSLNAYIASLTPTAEDGIDAVFMVDGEKMPLSFANQEDEKTIEGTEYELGKFEGLSTENPLARDYFELAWWGYHPEDGLDYSGHLAYGARTSPASLPTTTASYSGYMFGNFLADDGETPRWASHRHSLWGQLRLTADFDRSTISGMVDSLAIRRPADEVNEGDDPWTDLPETTSIAISESEIVQGRYIATWTGQDTDADNPMGTSARGFSGQMAGDFYGPNAEETAGVFSGNRDNLHIYGVFGATTAHEHLPNN